MAKKNIRVHTPFKFTHEDGTTEDFGIGEYTVDEKVSDHWFAAAHSEVTGKAKANADVKDLQAQIDSLTKQLEDKDKTIVELQQGGADKDATIEDLNKQLAAFQAPAGDDANGEKPKSADGK